MASSTAAALVTCSEDLLKSPEEAVVTLLCKEASERMETLLQNRPENWQSTTADPEDRSSVKKLSKDSLIFRVEVKVDFDELDNSGSIRYIRQAENKMRLMADCVRAGYGILSESDFYVHD